MLCIIDSVNNRVPIRVNSRVTFDLAELFATYFMSEKRAQIYTFGYLFFFRHRVPKSTVRASVYLVVLLLRTVLCSIVVCEFFDGCSGADVLDASY